MAYDGRDALLGAKLSDAIYKLTPKAARQQLASVVPQATEIVIRNTISGNSRVALVVTQSTLIMVFRGTVIYSPRSILANAKAIPMRWGKGTIHRGFFRLAWRARKVMRPAINKYNDGSRTVLMTGHSQGGAVAFLAAMLPIVFRKVSPTARDQVATVYTFGQPRAANPSFCRQAEHELGARYVRIANHRDIFVGLPRAGRWYDHIRDYVFYNAKGDAEFHRQSPGAQWPRRRNRIKYHRMQQYVQLATNNVNAHKP